MFGFLFAQDAGAVVEARGDLCHTLLAAQHAAYSLQPSPFLFAIMMPLQLIWVKSDPEAEGEQAWAGT